MSDTKKTTAAAEPASDALDEAAAQAEALEAEAQTEAGAATYTHFFKEPFTYEGRTFESLTFDWKSLKGEDSLAIEDEMLLHGKTLVTPEFTGIYLVSMAARACTERNSEGKRVVSTATLKAMPLGDFNKICKRARSFLLRAGR